MKIPRFLNPLYKLWCSFAEILGRIMSFLILSVLWLTFFSVYGIILKIISIKNLWKKDPETYWVDPPKDAGMQYQF